MWKAKTLIGAQSERGGVQVVEGFVHGNGKNSVQGRARLPDLLIVARDIRPETFRTVSYSTTKSLDMLAQETFDEVYGSRVVSSEDQDGRA